MSDAINAVINRIEEAQRVRVGDDVTPLDFLRAVYCNPNLPLPVRMRAAIEAAPFVHPKLSATAFVSGDSFAERLDRAIARSQGEPNVIEHNPPVPANEEPQSRTSVTT